MSTEKQIIERGIFIQGEVPSSKNSKEIGFLYMKKGSESSIYHKKNGVFRPVRLNLNSSKATKRYVKEREWDYASKKKEFAELVKDFETPYRICFKFFRKTKRKFDYINAAQIVQDMMVKYGWIEDDDASNMIPVFLEFEYNKTKPGVYVDIIR